MNEYSCHVNVLAVSPQTTDHQVLSRILAHSTWTLHSAADLDGARRHLANHHCSVVLCDQKLRDGDWKDLLSLTAVMDDPPQVIVLSTDGNERLWAEVLNLGAWDVLIKPFHPQEVYQTVHLAWRHWTDGRRTRTLAAVPRMANASETSARQMAVATAR